MCVFVLEQKCILNCTGEYNPQCGSDGSTYENPCIMSYATCRSNGTIALEYPGECSKYFCISDSMNSVKNYRHRRYFWHKACLPQEEILHGERNWSLLSSSQPELTREIPSFPAVNST